MNPRRLYRSRDRQLAGVAGGMAEYLDIDPTVMRILWIIVGIASGGLALVAYVILALVTPQAPYATAPGAWTTQPGAWAPAAGGWTQAPAGAGSNPGWSTPPAAPAWSPAPASTYADPGARPRAEGRGFGAAAIVGVVLIVFGAIALADAALPGWAAGAILGPAVILALGAALLISSFRRRPDEMPAAAAPAPASAPASAAAASASAPWDATDTQAVEASAFVPATGSAPDETSGQGARPA